MKKLATVLSLYISLSALLSCANAVKADRNFTVRYLLKDKKTEGYAVYQNDERISNLPMLQAREILDIRFDKDASGYLLCAEQKGNRYEVVKLNFTTGEEKILFGFERNIYSFAAFTENSFFWLERCEKNREPHILYEYNAKTKSITKLFEVQDKLDTYGERYDSRGITNVSATDDSIFFYQYGWDDCRTYVIDRTTGEISKSEIDIGWADIRLYKNKTIRAGVSVARDEKMKSYRTSKGNCVITDIRTFEETQCTFKKRYERQAGPLILISEDYFLAPFAVTPFMDSIKNGLFGSVWTVCYTVFDIAKNEAVFEGLIARTNELYLLDAVLVEN